MAAVTGAFSPRGAFSGASTATASARRRGWRCRSPRPGPARPVRCRFMGAAEQRVDLADPVDVDDRAAADAHEPPGIEPGLELGGIVAAGTYGVASR